MLVIRSTDFPAYLTSDGTFSFDPDDALVFAPAQAAEKMLELERLNVPARASLAQGAIGNPLAGEAAALMEHLARIRIACGEDESEVRRELGAMLE